MRLYFYITFSVLLFFSCGKKNETPENVLLQFGDDVITYDEVIDQIPDGIMANDSIALFNAIIDGWIKDVVLFDMAKNRLLDINAIERKVKDYRNDLIVTEYLSRMRESHNPKTDERRVREYYDKHRSELKLEVPLVKGIFLKINTNSKGKEKIKSMLLSDDPKDIDILEQIWLDKALEYNYFCDKWVDWQSITAMIPHRFGDPDIFLKENNYFEIEYDNCSYFLIVRDFLPSGEEQPYDFAAKWIAETLSQADLAMFEDALVESIVLKAIKDNRLKSIGYDPLTHELK